MLFDPGEHPVPWAIYIGAGFLFCMWIFPRTAVLSGLWRIPGPMLAKFSALYAIRHAARGDLHLLFIDLHHKYGPVVRYGPNQVSVSDLSAVPVIYGINSNFIKSPFFDGFTAVHDGAILQNIFATRDTAWHRRIKSAVAPMYSLSNLRKLEKLVDECTIAFLDCMKGEAGNAIDFGEWLQWYAFDVIGNITFAKTFGFLREKVDRHNIINNLEAGNIYNTIVGQVPGLHPWLLGSERFVKSLMKIPGLAQTNPMPILSKMIRDAIDASKPAKIDQEYGTHLEHLQQTQKSNPDRLSDPELWSSLATNLFAGSDTTATALRAIFYFLVKNPHSYQRLRDEIDVTSKAGKLSSIAGFQQAAGLPYLQAVIKESMRLHPAVSYPLERVVPKGGVDLCGHFLPEGTVIGVHPWVIHRDPRIFGLDADHFRPERWLGDDEARIKEMDRAFIPVLGSVWEGKNIAMLEMVKFVPSILLKYNVEWVSPNQEWSVSGYWFAKQSRVLMRLTSR